MGDQDSESMTAKEKIKEDLEKLIASSSELEVIDIVQELHASLVTCFERSCKKLKTERQKWDALEKKLDMAQLPEYFRLNVGGVIFSTSRANLLRYENSFFSALLSGRWEANLNEEIFIDRSPALFGLVIDFLRGSRSVVLDLSDTDRERLAIEADFYQLDELRKCCYYFETIGSGLELLGGKRAVRTTIVRGEWGTTNQMTDVSDRTRAVIVRPAINFPLQATFVEQTFGFCLPRGDAHIGVCVENDLDNVRQSNSRSRVVPLGKINWTCHKFRRNLEVESVFKIRVFNDYKVHWIECRKRKGKETEETLLEEKALENVTGPVLIGVLFSDNAEDPKFEMC